MRLAAIRHAFEIFTEPLPDFARYAVLLAQWGRGTIGKDF